MGQNFMTVFPCFCVAVYIGQSDYAKLYVSPLHGLSMILLL